MDSVIRELRFALQDRVFLLTLVVGGLLSIFTIENGLEESAAEKALIERVESVVDEDREFALAGQSDPGGAAYYAFHFTYDPPSELAFAARGVRDEVPWKHRMRMLALEGQIYETDTGNPELSRVGKLDFAFLVAFLAPLLLILLLYDLRAIEIRNNRWAFLSVTSGNGNKLLRNRALLRVVLLYLCIVIPFIVVAFSSNAGFINIALIAAMIAFNFLFWLCIALFIVSRVESGPTTAALLLGVWFLFAVVIPVSGKLVVEKVISVPNGGEILLTQREAVNDAWDLPKEATMTKFIERHPEWAYTPEIGRPFEWKWYYAFQQVGDQTVETLSQDLRAGITKRDQAMGIVSLASPSLLTTRLLSKVANTNIASFQRYDTCARDFHSSLREFHYPMLFGDTEYSSEQMQELPTFEPCTS